MPSSMIETKDKGLVLCSSAVEHTLSINKAYLQY